MAAGIGVAIGGALLKGILGNAPALLTAIDGIVSKHVEDPNARAQITLEMQKLVNARDLTLAEHAADLAQANLASASALNLADAQSGSLRRDWRSFIGWTLAGGVFYALLIQPMGTWAMTFVSAWFDINFPPPPELNWGQITALLATLLTGAGMSVATRAVGPK